MTANYIDIDLSLLKKIKYRAIRGIYFLYFENELVYVGQSIRIQHRIAEHMYGLSCINGEKKEFDSYNYIEISEDESLDNLEQLFILEYKPKYNKYGHGAVRYGKSEKEVKVKD